MSRPWVVVAFVIFAQRQFAVMLVVLRMVGAAAVEKQYHKAGVQQYAGCIEHGADVYDQFVSRCILYASSDRGGFDDADGDRTGQEMGLAIVCSVGCIIVFGGSR